MKAIVKVEEPFEYCPEFLECFTKECFQIRILSDGEIVLETSYKSFSSREYFFDKIKVKDTGCVIF